MISKNVVVSYKVSLSKNCEGAHFNKNEFLFFFLTSVYSFETANF